MASYYHVTKRDQSFDDVLVKLITTFKKDGFAVVTRADIQELLFKKLGVNIHRYVLFSVICPSSAYRAILSEDRIGDIIPCNVIVREKAESHIEVAAVDPLSIAPDDKSPELSERIHQLGKNIEKVILSI